MKFEGKSISEKMNDNGASITLIAKVFGGWVVMARLTTGSSLTFVPDEKHEWKIN